MPQPTPPLAIPSGGQAGFKQLAACINRIGAGMLILPDGHGSLKSRPMSPIKLDSKGSMWFLMRAPPADMPDGSGVNISFAQPDEASYVSVAGRAWRVTNRAQIEALWSSVSHAWFAGGKDDPELTLLRVDVNQAHYWDAKTSRMVKMVTPPTPDSKSDSST